MVLCFSICTSVIVLIERPIDVPNLPFSLPLSQSHRLDSLGGIRCICNIFHWRPVSEQVCLLHFLSLFQFTFPFSLFRRLPSVLTGNVLFSFPFFIHGQCSQQ
jgi:hypothetical protein